MKLRSKKSPAATDGGGRRKSWADADRKSSPIPEDPSSTKVEVKLRKGGSVEVTRPASLKKLKVADTKTKTAPSPVKATYRPPPMPVVDIVDEQEQHDYSGTAKHVP